MSADAAAVKGAIDSARALLETLLAGDWQEVHVSAGGTQIFIARDGGRANPMRAASTPAPAAAPDSVMTAPHVATLVDVRDSGAVAPGDTVATFSVLGDESTLAATSAGVVVAAHATPGSLVEYGAPIVTMIPNAG